MRYIMKSALHAMILVVIGCSWANAQTVDFEDVGASLPTNSFYNGGDFAGGFTSRGTFFNNSYSADFGGFWSGWAYSNVADPTTPGFMNQYAAYPGEGAGGSRTYGVAYSFDRDIAFLNLPNGSLLSSLSLANTTYAALAMRDGDQFSKQFGGATGLDPDFFKVILRGYSDIDTLGAETGSIEVFLADFRFDDRNDDYILDRWLDVDTSGLGAARSVGLEFASSDRGPFGINTPTYVAFDNLRFAPATVVPEPGGLLIASAAAAAFWIRQRGRRRDALADSGGGTL
jgi:hypothetical protein